MTRLEYKGYVGKVELDLEAKILYGQVVGLRDVITFQSETAEGIEQAFHDSVDDYLAFCAERKEQPEKPYSGKFLVRINPAFHRQLANLAELQGRSLNSAVEWLLGRALAAHLASEPSAADSEEIRELVGKCAAVMKRLLATEEALSKLRKAPTKRSAHKTAMKAAKSKNPAGKSYR